ncbi:MAG: hypothetical protein WKF73_00290 [Nocardioidaceae bacterium]
MMRSPLSLIPHPDSFTSRLRGPEIASRVGIWLGICFFVAFVTGLISHAAQDMPGWLTFPTRPVSLYRVTQGLHVISGTAAVPLLLVKLWSVFPKLFDRVDLEERTTARTPARRAPLDRVARLGGGIPACHRTGQFGAVVSLVVLVPLNPLRGCLDSHRRAALAHRGQAAGDS